MGNMITNFFKNLFGKIDCRILMVGLDAAGKTTILYYFKLGGELVHTLPTIGFNVESVHYKNLEFTVWDIGGQDRIRALWRLYYQETEGIIYVVDSHDRERIQEARLELYKLLKEEDLQDAILLIYANKQDLPGAMTTTEITEKLGLHGLRNRNWYVQATSAIKGDGLYQGLEWLSKEVRNRSKKKQKSLKYS